jgi:peptide chain release factor 2
MAGTDPADEITALTSTLDSIEAVLDPGEMQKEAADLRLQAADPELWSDPDRGQKVTRRLSYLDAELNRLAGLRQRLADTQVLFDLAERENDEPTKQEAAGELAALRAEIDQLEVRTLLNGEYEAREAQISINAQAGWADAADVPENVLRM